MNTAYLLKESFGQLWSYEAEGWARRFFENWRAALKWQRLKPYEKFADKELESRPGSAWRWSHHRAPAPQDISGPAPHNP